MVCIFLSGFYPKTKSLCLVVTLLVNYKIYTTYQFTYFIDVFNQEVTKDPKITLIQYLHQKIYTKHVWNIEHNVEIRLNMNQIGFTGETVTG